MQHMMCPSEVVGGDVLQNLQQSASSNSILYVERTESQTPIEAHRDILTQPQEEDNQN